MLTHDELMRIILLRTPNGDVFNVDSNFNTNQLVFKDNLVDPEFVNLLHSSAIMYQTLAFEKEQIGVFIEFAEMNKLNALINLLTGMLASVEMALAIAVNGIEAYGDAKNKH